MTPERILEIYQELEALAVPLQHEAQMGLTYFRDKMIECRRAQDRANALLMEINRAASSVRRAVRTQKVLVAVSTGTPEHAANQRRLFELESQDDDMRGLLDSVKAKSSNLRMTSSDIRLICSVVDQQIKLGEIYPGRVPHQPTPPGMMENGGSVPAELTAAIEPSVEGQTNSAAQTSESKIEDQPLTVVVAESEAEMADIDRFLNGEET